MNSTTRTVISAATLATLVVIAALLAYLTFHGPAPRTPDDDWHDNGNGTSWSCTKDGQQILRDDITGTITHGYDSRCDSNG